jgi:outer membrane immunogenic protein
VPAVYNWTGWYAGVNAGASFGNAKTDSNVAPFTVTSSGGVIASFQGFGRSNREYPDGFIGGGQIGYNWQYSPLIVVGLEADFQGAVERDSSNLYSTSSANTGDTATAVTNLTAKIDWFGTVRGRIGYVWGNGNVLSYVTGGLAYGKVELDGTVSGFIDGVIPFSLGQGSHSQVNTGWVVGYGTEGVIDFWGARNWTWKIEGLYMDLGHVDTTGAPGISLGALPPTTFTGTGGQVTTHTHFTDGILRAGLNYKFY